MTISIDQALRESAAAAGLNELQIAYRIERTQQAVQNYMSGKNTPGGETIVRLMREVPGFAERLGFQPVAHAA